MFKKIFIVHPTDQKLIKALQLFLEGLGIQCAINFKFYPPNTENVLADLAVVEGPVLLICSGEVNFGSGDMYAGQFAKVAKSTKEDVFVLAYSKSDKHQESRMAGELDAFILRWNSDSYFQRVFEIGQKHPSVDGDLRLDYQLAEFISEALKVNNLDELHHLIEGVHQGKVFEPVKH